MLRKTYDLFLVGVLTVVCALILEQNEFLQIIAGMTLGVVLPSYALGSALFPHEEPGAEHVVFSVALSFALTILGGFVLNMTEPGLTATSWSWYMAVLTLAGCAAAYWRRTYESAPAPAESARVVSPASGDESPDNLAPAEEHASQIGEPLSYQRLIKQLASLERHKPASPITNWLLVALAMMVFGVSFLLSSVGADLQPHDGFTQFWILPVDPDEQDSFQLGIESQELKLTTYRVEFQIDGQLIRTWDNIDIMPGKQWETTVELPESSGVTSRITALLYRADMPDEVYRRTTWTTGPM